jgi:hypothetical protein
MPAAPPPPLVVFADEGDAAVREALLTAEAGVRTLEARPVAVACSHLGALLAAGLTSAPVLLRQEGLLKAFCGAVGHSDVRVALCASEAVSAILRRATPTAELGQCRGVVCYGNAEAVHS